MPKFIVALTDAKIAQLKPGAQRFAVYDPAVPGLAIRVQPSGHKTFVFGATYPRTRHFSRLELGQVGALTLAAAREKARTWAQLIATGVDPRDEVARVANNTFAVVAEAFIARHLKHKRKAHAVAREIRKELLPVWGARPVTSITRRDVVELIEAIVDRPTAEGQTRTGAYAHNILAHIRQVFNWAINRDIYGLSASPTDRLKPKDLIGAKQPRERVLTDSELRALWSASDALGYPFGAVVKMLMLTGARLGEVTGARWPEFDFENQCWTVPAARYKTNMQHYVPLTDDLIALLESLPHWRDDCLFSTNGQRPLRFCTKPRAKLDAAMRASLGSEPPPFVLHDIRRTVRTRLSELRVQDHVAELVIGHARRGIAGTYDRHKYQTEMREALNAWAARLRSIIAPPPANVVRLRKSITPGR
jgi:integrase